MKTILVLLVGVCGLIKAADSWSYDAQYQWPGVCRTGKKQSPINIMTWETIFDKSGAHIRGPLQYQGYRAVNLTGTNNGHTLQWDIREEDAPPVLSGGPLRGGYNFAQLHLHWIAEHAIDGRKYGLEIHFVHIKEGLSFEQAVLREDGIAVIGVMCDVVADNASATALDEIMVDVPKLRNKDSKISPFRAFDVARLFSPDTQSYYTYYGSLTTPNCEEAVTWIVMDKPIAISDHQFQLITETDVGTPYNYRSLQPANRVVYRVKSCANLIGPNLIGTLGVLLNCFLSQIKRTFQKGVCAFYDVKRKVFGVSHGLKECANVLN